MYSEQRDVGHGFANLAESGGNLSFFLSFFLYLYSTCVPNQIGYYTTQMHQLPAMQGDIVRDKGTRILPRAQLKDERRNELQDKRWKFSQQHSLTQ